MKTAIAFSLLGALASAHGQLASSSSYTLLHGGSGQSGGPAQGATVTADLSTGGAAVGVAAVATVEGKGGFTGQLYDPVSLAVTATPPTVAEAGTSQLSAEAAMDDDTVLPLTAGDVIWQIIAGQVQGINSGGQLTAGHVYEDGSGGFSGFWNGLVGTGSLGILNVGDDDFGSYAGDGVDDDWQVGFFGLDNLLAAPGEDPDGDKQTNLFEFLAGVDPLDPSSLFSLSIELVPGQPDHRAIIFDFLPDRTYVVRASTDPGTLAFDPLVSPLISNDGTERTVTDTGATELRKFYRLEITKP